MTYNVWILYTTMLTALTTLTIYSDDAGNLLTGAVSTLHHELRVEPT
jgi:hypothetical protein